MKKYNIILLLVVLLIACLKGYGQYPKENILLSDSADMKYVGYNLSVANCKNEINNNTTYVRVNAIFKSMYKEYTVVQLYIYKVGGIDRLTINPSPQTSIKYCNGTQESWLMYIGYPGNLETPVWWLNKKIGYDAKDYEGAYLNLYFQSIPPGCGTISILDPGQNVNGVYLQMPSFYNLEWFSNEDWESVPEFNGNFKHTSHTEASVQAFAKSHNDGICGIYQGIGGNQYKLGCIKENGVYKIIYLGSNVNYCWWNVGDVKAILHSTATKGRFNAEWVMRDKQLHMDSYVTFTNQEMLVTIPGTSPDTDTYFKLNASANNNYVASGGGNNNYYEPPFDAKWTGTGFALNRGYIATNHHVIDGARNIKVYGVKGNFNIGYDAQVVLSDAHNDLAVIKINDSRFTSFGTIPYRVKTAMAEVGEDVFVLGYPMTSTMGDEIKLTTGVVSARSGFQGDLSLYQTTAPIQPGNSGGPLFDNSGNLIGIVNSKHRGAENVGYAIKASYLSNLIQSGSMSGLLPQTNSISGQSLSGKVKSVKNFVFLIKCN